MFQFSQKFKRFIQLSFSQKKDVGEAIFRLLFAVSQIKLRSIDWFWKKNMQDNAADNEGDSNADIVKNHIQVATSLHESIRLASRLLPFPCECVPRSMVLRDMLRKNGIASNIKIGVKTVNLDLHSHAWVEVYGEAIGEKDGLKSSFKTIDKVPFKED